MNDNISYAMDADYKVYELDAVIDYLEGLMVHPSAKKTLNANWNSLFKSASRLRDLINNLEAPNAGNLEAPNAGAS